MRAAVAALFFVVAVPSYGMAEFREADFRACASKANPHERLACFDGLGTVKPTGAVSEGRRVTVPEVMADFSELSGTRVTARGFVLMMGQQALLYAEMGSMTALFVDVESLPRDQRRSLFERCSGGCSAEFTGKVTKIIMQPGIRAEAVSFK